MRFHLAVTLALACVAAACGTTDPDPQLSLDPNQTGLQGEVRLGPVPPVCQVDSPCSIPIEGKFVVQSANRPFASFRSDAAGRFSIPLPPGDYLVLPGPGTPVPFHGQQAVPVTVVARGPTEVTLVFDSFLR